MLSSFWPPFYENKAVLPKHGKGFTFQTVFFFFLRDFFFPPFSETEDSGRPYSPHEPEEETNEIERQQSKAQDATVQSWPRTHQPSASTGTDDSEKNEVISTQQMCKEFT